jgi:hypothetical protein
LWKWIKIESVTTCPKSAMKNMVVQKKAHFNFFCSWKSAKRILKFHKKGYTSKFMSYVYFWWVIIQGITLFTLQLALKFWRPTKSEVLVKCTHENVFYFFIESLYIMERSIMKLINHKYTISIIEPKDFGSRSTQNSH